MLKFFRKRVRGLGLGFFKHFPLLEDCSLGVTPAQNKPARPFRMFFRMGPTGSFNLVRGRRASRKHNDSCVKECTSKAFFTLDPDTSNNLLVLKGGGGVNIGIITGFPFSTSKTQGEPPHYGIDLGDLACFFSGLVRLVGE